MRVISGARCSLAGFLVASLPLLLACGSDVTDVASGPSQIAITQPNTATGMFVAVNETVPIEVQVRDASGSPIEATFPLAFVSRDTTVATVSDSGIVTAKRLGDTEIVVTLQQGTGALADSIHVTVSGF